MRLGLRLLSGIAEACDAIGAGLSLCEIQQHSDITYRIFDYGRSDDGSFYYVMEYLNGVTLTELVNDAGPVPPGRTIHILRQVAAALREAVAAGVEVLAYGVTLTPQQMWVDRPLPVLLEPLQVDPEALLVLPTF